MVASITAGSHYVKFVLQLEMAASFRKSVLRYGHREGYQDSREEKRELHCGFSVDQTAVFCYLEVVRGQRDGYGA